MELINRFEADVCDMLSSMLGHTVVVKMSNGIMTKVVSLIDGDRHVVYDLGMGKMIELGDLKMSEVFDILEAYDRAKDGHDVEN